MRRFKTISPNWSRPIADTAAGDAPARIKAYEAAIAALSDDRQRCLERGEVFEGRGVSTVPRPA